MLIRKWFYLSVVTLLLFTGCATSRLTNLSPADLESEPSIQLYIDPMFDASGYKTFSVFPSSLIEEKIQLGGVILEKQMLFALRNAFEEIGYKIADNKISKSGKRDINLILEGGEQDLSNFLGYGISKHFIA